MIACSIYTWVGFWIFGAIAGIILMGMARTPAKVAVVDAKDLSRANPSEDES